ncbi:MAG TPA: hypothetical protein VFB04_04205 [Terriglobales bacterium]|nr:hypothetical protein [Terriglobales bacterium]
MTLETFRQSLHREEPPRQLSLALTGLWWDAKGDWKQAHDVVGQDEGPAAAWVHAYLHRKEGDLANSRYWYKRACKEPATASLDAEWQEVTEALLAESDASL